MGPKAIVVFDLDGVIVDVVSSMLPILSRLTGREIRYGDITNHDIPEALGLNLSHDELYAQVELHGCYERAEPIPGSVDVLTGLSVPWTVVTSRPERLKDTTENWILSHIGRGVPLRFAQRTTKYLDPKCRVIVDDDPVALRASPVGPTKLMLQQPWNARSRFRKVETWSALSATLAALLQD